MRTANTEIRECVKWSLTKEMRAERVGKEEAKGRERMGARLNVHVSTKTVFFWLLLLSFYPHVNDPSSSKFFF